jgi:hypothetical protein
VTQCPNEPAALSLRGVDPSPQVPPATAAPGARPRAPHVALGRRPAAAGRHVLRGEEAYPAPGLRRRGVVRAGQGALGRVVGHEGVGVRGCLPKVRARAPPRNRRPVNARAERTRVGNRGRTASSASAQGRCRDARPDFGVCGRKEFVEFHTADSGAAPFGVLDSRGGERRNAGDIINVPSRLVEGRDRRKRQGAPRIATRFTARTESGTSGEDNRPEDGPRLSSTLPRVWRRWLTRATSAGVSCPQSRFVTLASACLDTCTSPTIIHGALQPSLVRRA